MHPWWYKNQLGDHNKNEETNNSIDHIKGEIIDVAIEIDDHLCHKGLNEGKENSHEQEIEHGHFTTTSMIAGTRDTMVIAVTDTHIAKVSQNKYSGYNLFLTE